MAELVILVKMLGLKLEVRALCHDNALVIGDFNVASSVLLKVDQDLEIPC